MYNNLLSYFYHNKSRLTAYVSSNDFYKTLIGFDLYMLYMVYQTAKNVESVWNELNQKIEYQSSAVSTSKDNRSEISVLTIELPTEKVCEIVSHTYSDNTNKPPIQEIVFYTSDNTIQYSVKQKTIEETITIILEKV